MGKTKEFYEQKLKELELREKVNSAKKELQTYIEKLKNK